MAGNKNRTGFSTASIALDDQTGCGRGFDNDCFSVVSTLLQLRLYIRKVRCPHHWFFSGCRDGFQNNKHNHNNKKYHQSLTHPIKCKKKEKGSSQTK
ncbi:hypothetical protein DERF_003009 [Dermatophagoides farinae]|uniref:Uncharacterized protein n=1 Tax=Dermatophagoides farinae TaxID=6954 RepID=A0A922LDG0_DERFA|nr:hypothetical protein DERF_003009 [Dermatophagoides farinae]